MNLNFNKVKAQQCLENLQQNDGFNVDDFLQSIDFNYLNRKIIPDIEINVDNNKVGGVN